VRVPEATVVEPAYKVPHAFDPLAEPANATLGIKSRAPTEVPNKTHVDRRTCITQLLVSPSYVRT